MKHGIVIPCYNEANRLKFEAFQKFLIETHDTYLCFVNDGSSDNTLDLLSEFASNFEKKVSVVNMVQNAGKAEAVRMGITYLLEHTDVKDLGFMDADLSTSFEEFNNLFAHLNKSDQPLKLVFGSRKGEAAKNTERSYFRKLMSDLIGFMIQIILGLPIKDTQCGAKVFTSETARYCFKNPFVSRWLFDVEIFIRMRRLYSKDTVMRLLGEIPLKKWIAVGESKLTLKESIKIPLQLIRIGTFYHVRPGFEKMLRFISSFSFGLFNFQKS